MQKLKFPGRALFSSETDQQPGLGMFGGVYTPSILTILGVIMYLRFGWVVANVGLVGTLLIVTLATSITCLTGLSIAEIATDRVIKTGGAYYMISRSLGIEVGGAVGIPLYIAQTLSMALYVIGFAESLVITFPALDQKLVGIVTTVLVAAVALKSASFAIRTQYLIMAAIALSLISLAFGHPVAYAPAPEGVDLPNKESFWVVFAVFFPAVTGIMAGVGMSGDLKNPTKAIPIGTLAAIATGYVIYMIIPFFLYFRADTVSLLNDPLVMQKMAFWGDAILLGVWGATLSSALGSILGAPRVLQALVRDRVLPTRLRWLGTGSGPLDEPRVGTFATLVIVLIAVVLGDLNLLAPILTMFFLTTYLVLNVAAGLENFLNSPSFRPTFRVHWLLSLLGAMGCLAVMFLINALATVIAAATVIGVFVWLKEREIESAWGDIRRGLWMTLVRQGVLQLGHDPHLDARNWRPQMIVLSGVPRRRWSMIALAAALTHNRGLTTVVSVLPKDARSIDQQTKSEALIRDYMIDRGVEGLVRLVMADDAFLGAEQFVQHYGLGPLVPNTILLGASQQGDLTERYCQMLVAFHRLRRNVLVFQDNRTDDEQTEGERIDIWLRNLQANGSLMLILAYLMQGSSDWRGAEIRLKLLVPRAEAVSAAQQNLQQLVEQVRLNVIPEVVTQSDQPLATIIPMTSADADLVFLGLDHPDEDFVRSYQDLQQVTQHLSRSVLVLAAPDFTFMNILAE